MANTGVIGKVVDAVSGLGIDGLAIKAYDIDPLASETQLGKTVTTAGGGVYTILYSPSDYRSWFSGDNPDIEVRVFGAGNRLFARNGKQIEDVTDTTLSMPDIKIHPSNFRDSDNGATNPADIEVRRQDPYWLVAHTGAESGDRHTRATDGAATRIEWLVDGGGTCFPRSTKTCVAACRRGPVVHDPPPPPPPAAGVPSSHIKLINMGFDPKLASHFTFPPGKDETTVLMSDLVVVGQTRGEVFKAQAAAPHPRSSPCARVGARRRASAAGCGGGFDSADDADELRKGLPEFARSAWAASRAHSFLHVKFVLRRRQNRLSSR